MLDERSALIEGNGRLNTRTSDVIENPNAIIRRCCACNDSHAKMANVIVMGLGFMLLFTAYNTTQNFVTTMFGKLGFYSLSVIYGVVAVSVVFSPVLVPKMGERLSMWIGAGCYCIYIASLVKVDDYAVYSSSVVLGFGSAVLWVAQGAFLTKCSDETTRGRNSGLFWGIFQLSGIFGNFAAWLIIDGHHSSSFLFLVLLVCGSCGVVVLFCLQSIKPTLEYGESGSVKSVGTLVWNGVRLLGRRDMILMLVFMFYSGIELSFFSGEFPNLLLTKDIGAVMSVFGAAEVLGGLLVGKLSDMIGRKVVVVFAVLIYSGALAMCWLLKLGILSEHYSYLIAAMLGLGDSTFNTQIYASLGTLFPGDETIPAFMIFQLLQNLGSAIGFFAAPKFPVHGPHGTVIQLGVLGGIGVIGAFLYLFVDLKRRRMLDSMID